MCKDIEIYLSQSFSLFYFYTGISAFPRWSFFTYTLLYYVSTAANIAFYTHPIMSYFMKNSTWTTNWIISVIYGLGILKGTHFNGIIFWLASMSLRNDVSATCYADVTKYYLYYLPRLAPFLYAKI